MSGRARRWGRRALRVLAWIAGGVLAVLLLVVLLIDSPIGHRLIKSQVNSLLAGEFRGRLSIEQLGWTSLLDGQIRGATVVLHDPDDNPVARLEGISADVDLLALLHNWRGDGRLDIPIRSVEIKQGWLTLAEDESGELAIANSFASDAPPGPPGGREVGVQIRRIALGSVEVVQSPDLSFVAQAFVGALGYSPEELRIQVDAVTAKAQGLLPGLDPEGQLGGVFRLDPENTEQLRASASFTGRFGPIAVFTDAVYDSGSVQAAISVPATPSAPLRQALDVPLDGTVALLAYVEGPLPYLDATVTAYLADGSVEARVSARVSTPVALQVSAKVEALSPQAFQPDAPEERVSLFAEAHAWQDLQGEFRVDGSVRTLPLYMEGIRVPPLAIDADYDGVRVNAQILSEDPELGAEINATYRLAATEAEPQRLDVTVAVNADNLAALEYLPMKLGGRVVVAGSGSVTMREGQPPLIAAKAELEGSRLSIADTRVASALVSVQATGTPSAMRGNARLDARGLEAAGQRIRRVRVEADGSTESAVLRVRSESETVPAVDGALTLNLLPSLAARDVNLGLRFRGERVQISAVSVKAERSGVRVERLVVVGPGSVTVSGYLAPRGFDFQAEGHNVELTQVARMAQVKGVDSGRLSFTADLEERTDGIHGSLSAALSQFRSGTLRGGTAAAKLEFAGPEVSGNVRATLGESAELHVEADSVRVPDYQVRGFRGATGALSISGSVDLQKLNPMLPDAAQLVDDAEGTVEFEVVAERRADSTQITFDVRTRKLEFTERVSTNPNPTRQEAAKSTPLRVSGYDLEVKGKATDSGRSHVAANLRDRHGPLVALRVEAALPLGELLANPALASATLRRLDVQADLRLPERKLEHWPEQVRPGTLTGNVGVHAALRGSLEDPAFSVRVRGRQIRSRANPNVSPAELRLSFAHAKDRGNAGVNISHGDGKLEASSDYQASWKDLLAGKDPRLVANIKLEAKNYAIDRIPVLSSRELAGRLDGRIELTGLGRDAKLDGALEFRKLQVARVPVDSASVRVKSGDGKFESTVTVKHPAGHMDLELNTGLIWKENLAPKLPDDGELELRAKAKNFRLGTLLPLVSGSVAKLDGRIDADLSARLGKDKQVLQGHAELREGLVQVPAIGQELRDIRARVELEPDGAIYLRDASARGVTGRVRVAASARLDGLRLAAFRAVARIDEKEPIPLTVEGVSLGNMWGTTTIAGRSTPEQGMAMEVEVNSFHLDMPSLTPRSVQSLEPAPHVRVGVRRDGGRLVELPLQPLLEDGAEEGEGSPLVVKVKLGNDVWLKQGTMLEVKLEGEVTMRAGATMSLEGRVSLPRGQIDMSGKLFKVVDGTVTFTGEPDNPVVVATVSWDAPDGTVVYADFSGPAKTGQVRLRSDPPLSENEILSLLLFGSVDGMVGADSSSESDGAATAASVGGGVATQGLNAGLRRVSNLDITTRVDTSEERPRPEVAVQISPRVTAEVAYKIGEPTPGKAPDRTLLTFDFRLSSRWSVATTFGDRGSSLLELLWRFRY